MKIDQAIVAAIFLQGEKELPAEACGYLAGHEDHVTHRYPMTNTDHSPEHFTLDPQEQFKVIKTIRQEGLQLLAVYHTHPQSPARPSDEDIKLAYDPTIVYIIASLIGAKAIKAFKIVKGIGLPLELEIV
jgi:proteasome lid subunit RPN8/RPN11